MLGSGHSFSPVADTTGDLLSLAALPAELEIADNTVTISAGLRYGELVGPVHEAGLALPNTGSLPHIMVAGACATGTHGSGESNKILAASVSAVELVGPSGELRTVRRGDPGFAGSVVALGALGVVTRLTLDLIPTFDVRQTVVEGLRSYDDVPEALAAAYSVSLFTYFAGAGFEQVWLKQRADEPVLPRAGWARNPPTVRATWCGASTRRRARRSSGRPAPGTPGFRTSGWTSRRATATSCSRSGSCRARRWCPR